MFTCLCDHWLLPSVIHVICYSSSLKQDRIRLASLYRYSPALGIVFIFIFNCLSITQLETSVSFQTASESVIALCFLALVNFHRNYRNILLKIKQLLWLYAYVVVPLWELWNQTSNTSCPLWWNSIFGLKTGLDFLNRPARIMSGIIWVLIGDRKTGKKAPVESRFCPNG